MIKTPLAVKRILSRFPSQLPVGLTHYREWLAEVVELIGPIATIEDLQFCVSAEVLRLGPTTCSIAKHTLVRKVRAGAAKQIAGFVFTEIKEKQQAAQQAAAKQAAEVTAAQAGTNGETIPAN